MPGYVLTNFFVYAIVNAFTPTYYYLVNQPPFFSKMPTKLVDINKRYKEVYS